MAKLCITIMHKTMHKNYVDIQHSLERRMCIERKRAVIIKKWLKKVAIYLGNLTFVS